MKESEENKPFVSIIIPCRNEEKYIGKCLDSIIANDYPKDKLEVLVMDGMSEDGTRGVVEKYVKEYSFIKLLRNPKKIIPVAMNIGIKNAKGDIILKLDAHSAYQKDYISKCIRYLKEYNADNVGGIWKIVPREDTLLGKSIALALSSPFGAGNAYYRIGVTEPKWVDTVPYGCYKKEVFERIGFYDENIARSEDVALNSKLRKSGGKILLVPEIVIYYYARSKLNEFYRHIFDNGFWITYPIKFGRILFSWRHLIPLLFVLSLLGGVILVFFYRLFLWPLFSIMVLYFLTNIYFSLKVAIRERDLRYLIVMPIIFITLHITYGLGSVWGLIKILGK